MAGFRLALAQTSLVPASHEDAFSMVARIARKAKEGGAGLVLFSELVLCGYGDPIRSHRLAMAKAAAEERLGVLASDIGIAIAAGYAERQGEHVYNAALVVDAFGRGIANYRKMHLWGAYEETTFAPGEPGEIFPLAPDLRAGLLICFDLDHPAAAQDLTARGANIVLVLSATSAPYAVVPQAQVPARAYENSVFVAFCNQAGEQPYDTFIGLSTVAAPDGSVLARCRERADDLVFADIEPAAFVAYRAAHDYAAKRRRDLFPEPARKNQQP